jgi:hypothetical protein
VARSLILLIFGASLCLLAVHRLRRYRLKERYALLFVVLGLPFLLLGFRPLLIYRIAKVLGIDPNTVIILCVAIFLILMVFELLTIVSQQDQKITTLAQMVGILTEKLEKRDQNSVAATPASPPFDEKQKATQASQLH